MSRRLKPAAIVLFAILALLGYARGAGAASVYDVLPFENTGNNPPSHYGYGSYPESELLQASDGNYYGTTAQGGSGVCPSDAKGDYIGCGTISGSTPRPALRPFCIAFPMICHQNRAGWRLSPGRLIQGARTARLWRDVGGWSPRM